ncbi:MAG: hypothetical protein JNK93_18275 [Planctomycetia bacterium]|nr:hypothetical protein [Planctomycetia bacterium]
MPAHSVRPRPAIFRALGTADPPATVEVDGETFHRDEIFKHDSWAATALYSNGRRRIVCKFNRMQPVGWFATDWIGRRLAARERAALERLADLPNVPKALGDVRVDGRIWRTAVARAHVAGHPLGKGERVGPAFFPTLEATLATMHDRGLAYVDLHKRENIIVGDDGRPHLIDFQIGFDAAHRRVRHWPGAAWLFTILCRSDLYHLAKHLAKHDPVRGGEAARTLKRQRPWWIRAHRFAAVPLREARRRLLKTLGVRSGAGRVESELFVEDGLRVVPARRAA